MRSNESEPIYTASTPTGEDDGVIATTARRRWRASSVVIAGAVGALVIACGATGIAAAVRIGSLEAGSSLSTASGGRNATLLPQRGTPGPGGTGSTSRVSESTSASPSTSAQSVGVVVIDTVLKYQGAEAAGTGIVLTSNGEILTNNHVIDGATGITVTVVTTGKTYTADVATSDIAVLQLEGASGLSPATTGSSGAGVADAVTAVGNAGGTGVLAAATGTVTALDQTVTASGEIGAASETLTGLIETNADVVAGDSGGPLYDAQGKVIGIDTAAAAGNSATSGFAIPIATALRVADQIGSGVPSAAVTIGYPAFRGVELNQASGAATIAGVLAGTPAATAGLAAGDTITTLDGTAITSGSQLSSLLGAHRPGDSVTLAWTDAGGAGHSAAITLIAGAAN
jgi:S1-C subfamily serine protease